MAEQERFADTVHPIHYSSVARQDHGMVKVAFLHEARVFYDVSTRQLDRSLIGPVRFIDLTY